MYIMNMGGHSYKQLINKEKHLIQSPIYTLYPHPHPPSIPRPGRRDKPTVGEME